MDSENGRHAPPVSIHACVAVKRHIPYRGIRTKVVANILPALTAESNHRARCRPKTKSKDRPPNGCIFRRTQVDVSHENESRSDTFLCQFACAA